jgi:REP element-mobilizing transposase RayT
MARPLRVEHSGGWYHITARGNERRAIFRDDRDRSHFLELLGEMVERFRVNLHCYVLMDNHYHLVLELRQCNLSLALQWLNVSYSVWFNRRHDRCGHLFQGRFKSVLFSAPASALEISRYVHLNPVRTDRLGLGKSARAAMRAGGASKPDIKQIQARITLLRQYRWSSYRAYIASGPAPLWLTLRELYGPHQHQGRLAAIQERYRAYVESAIREGLETTGIWAQMKEGAILGSERFVEQMRGRLDGDKQEQRAARRLKAEKVEWPKLVSVVEKVRGEAWDQFRDRHGDTGRDMLLYLGRRQGGMKLKELAVASGLESYGAVAMAIKRYQNILKVNSTEAARINKVNKMLNVNVKC